MNRLLAAAALGAGGYCLYRALKPRYSFRDRHVVITGGPRGLGLVLARKLAKEGARLSICSRDSGDLLRAEAELKELGVPVTAVECDVTDPARVREFLTFARQMNGPVDVLINNAGVIRVAPLEELTSAEFEQSLRIHFWGAYHTTQEVLPEMQSRGEGRIINISSIGGKVAVPHLLPYSVGKFALVGFSNGLRAEVARHGVVVTTVCPGLMRTGSHLNAEFKGNHEAEYAWFAFSNGIPGFSCSAESAARAILAASARGDGELVIGLPAKLAVAMHALFPNLTMDAMAMVNRWILPEPGGSGQEVTRGRDNHHTLPRFVTRLSDRAAALNNELHSDPVPPPVPQPGM